MTQAKEKVVAIGPLHEIIGLRSIGVEISSVENAGELEAILRQEARRPEVPLVIVSESVAEAARETVEELRSEGVAMIVLVPSHRGSRGTTLEWLKHAMEQSIGVDLISGD